MKGVFNKPWMSNINPYLLMRYWIKSKSYEDLITNYYGINVRHVKTIYGIVSYKISQTNSSNKI